MIQTPPEIRLVAVDMDGTLLNSRKEVPSDFPSWVLSHPDVLVMAASGRQYYNLQKTFPDLENALVFSADNGALVFYRGKLLYQNLMDIADVRDVIRTAGSIPGVYPIVCGVQSAYMCHPSDHALREAKMYYARLAMIDSWEDEFPESEIVKVALFFSAYDAEKQLHVLSVLPSRLTSLLSGVCWIDVENASVSKGTALTAVREAFGISRAQCMAFGDYLNDMSLLKAVEESYAMANGHEELKKSAKHIAPSNDEGGVMQILRQLN